LRAIPIAGYGIPRTFQKKRRRHETTDSRLHRYPPQLAFAGHLPGAGDGRYYERAAKLRDKFQRLAVNVPEPANAIEKTSLPRFRFWYRKSVKGGNEFVVVDAGTLVKKPAFDHERLAVSLCTAAGEKYTAQTLPFNTFQFADNESAITFAAAGSNWRCDLSDYACRKTGTAAGGQGQPGGNPTDGMT
jgi:hypothetical protein